MSEHWSAEACALLLELARAQRPDREIVEALRESGLRHRATIASVEQKKLWARRLGLIDLPKSAWTPEVKAELARLVGLGLKPLEVVTALNEAFPHLHVGKFEFRARLRELREAGAVTLVRTGMWTAAMDQALIDQAVPGWRCRLAAEELSRLFAPRHFTAAMVQWRTLELRKRGHDLPQPGLPNSALWPDEAKRMAVRMREEEGATIEEIRMRLESRFGLELTRKKLRNLLNNVARAPKPRLARPQMPAVPKIAKSAREVRAWARDNGYEFNCLGDLVRINRERLRAGHPIFDVFGTAASEAVS